MPRTKRKSANKSPRSGYAIASLISGIVSFFPPLSIFGIVAIVTGILGVLKTRNKAFSGRKMAIAGIILGIVGLPFTLIIISYFLFTAKNGPFYDTKKALVQQELTQDAGQLELYKKNYYKYPATLTELNQGKNYAFTGDAFMGDFFYKVSADGKSYDLRSLGPDGVYGTVDDIFPVSK